MFAEALDGKSTNTVNTRVNSSRNPANVNDFPLPDEVVVVLLLLLLVFVVVEDGKGAEVRTNGAEAAIKRDPLDEDLLGWKEMRDEGR